MAAPAPDSLPRVRPASAVLSVAAGILAGALDYLSDPNLPAAVLIGGGAVANTLLLFHGADGARPLGRAPVMTPGALSDPDPRRRVSTRTQADPVGSPDTRQCPDSSAPAVPPEVVAAFSVFYRDAAPRLVAFLRWHGAALPDAADCAHDALAECYRRWTTIDQPYRWCRTVAARRYAQHVGAVREQPTDTLDGLGAPLLPPDTDLDALEHRHTILALLDTLPVRQRQVLAWTYDGATTDEIAHALQISTENVRSHLRHARNTLRARRHQLGVDR